MLEVCEFLHSYVSAHQADTGTNSTTVVAIIRLAQLRHYAQTTNPTMDDVGPDVWTMLELNVGVFCVCMPSARKFVARRFPALFSTVEPSNKYTPNSHSGSSKRSAGKRPLSSLGGITKSVDTRVERFGEDDQVELVSFDQDGRNKASSVALSVEKDDHSKVSEHDVGTNYVQHR